MVRAQERPATWGHDTLELSRGQLQGVWCTWQLWCWEAGGRAELTPFNILPVPPTRGMWRHMQPRFIIKSPTSSHGFRVMARLPPVTYGVDLVGPDLSAQLLFSLLALFQRQLLQALVTWLLISCMLPGVLISRSLCRLYLWQPV